MLNSYASFTPEQLQFLGEVVVLFGVAFIGLVWRMAKWHSRVEYDLDNFGEILGTEKAKARLERKQRGKK